VKRSFCGLLGEGWRGGVKRERVSGVGNGGRRGVCSVGKEFRWGNMCGWFMVERFVATEEEARGVWMCMCGMGGGFVRVWHVVSVYVSVAVLRRYVTFSNRGMYGRFCFQVSLEILCQLSTSYE